MFRKHIIMKYGTIIVIRRTVVFFFQGQEKVKEFPEGRNKAFKGTLIVCQLCQFLKNCF